MELVVTKVERGVDGFERLEVDINLEEKGRRFYVKIGQTKGMMRLNSEHRGDGGGDLLLLPFVGDYGATVDDQSVRWHLRGRNLKPNNKC